MPRYDGYTLDAVKQAIDPGKPDSLTTTAGQFDAAVEALRTLAEDIGQQASIIVGGESAAWSGPAAASFALAVDTLVARIAAAATTYAPYQPALAGASTALQNAQTLLGDLVDRAGRLRAAATTARTEALLEQIDERAATVLNDLAAAYTTALATITGDEDQVDDPADSSAEEVADGPIEADLAGPDGLADETLSLDGLAPDGVSPVGLSPLDLSPLDLSPLGLVPAGLGNVDGLSLGSIDPSSHLAGLDPLPSSGLVLGRPSVSPLDTTLTGGAAGLLPGAGVPPGAVPGGLNGATRGLVGAAGGAAPGAGVPPFMPLAPMGGMAPGGRRSTTGRRTNPTPRGPAPVPAVIGRPDDKDRQQRRSNAVGDEQWDDDAGLRGAIGREQAPQPRRG
jgi:hypothetical protein